MPAAVSGFYRQARANPKVAKGLAIGTTAYHKMAMFKLGTPILVLACLSMITLPMPPVLLDMLFSFNIALSMVVLLVAIYAKKPLDFGSFPTVLLLTTILRLSLNVASTRVILLHGQDGTAAAGKVIEAFGHVVMGGSYTVGIIVFTILMIINFVVVTKGAGRISEVAPLKDTHSIKNYIDFPHPNNDGYRGIHLITRHDAPSVDLRGLFCETQVRTRLQHAWATALETYDVASREGLKFGRGSENAKRFFQIASALFAMAEGGSTTGVVAESVEELRRELLEIEEQDHIQKRLQACSGSVAILSDESFSGAAYCVLDIDFELQCTSLYTFSEEDVSKAERLYFELERRTLEGESTLKDALLVKVSSLKGLGDAYPNYLVNVRFFLESLSRLLA